MRLYCYSPLLCAQRSWDFDITQISYFQTGPEVETGLAQTETNLFFNTTHLTLTDLSPNTEYNVSIHAWTINGPRGIQHCHRKDQRGW